MHRLMREALDRWLPEREGTRGQVHRSFVAEAFRAGVAAVVLPLIDQSERELDDAEIAARFEEWLEETFAE